MRRSKSRILNSAMLAGAGSLLESAERTIKKRIARRRRARAFSRAAHVLTRAGVIVAIATVAFGTVAAIRSASQPARL